MTKNILIVDDDPLVVNSISRYLKSCGYGIEIAHSGKEALEKTERLNFDLIISDIRMPGMDGIQTLKRIREIGLTHHKDKVPAIIITGYAGTDEFFRNTGDLGIVEYVYKPFELDEFIEIIRKNLELSPKYKRTYPRTEVAFPVEVAVKEPASNLPKKISGKTIDLNESGIGLILDSLLPIFSTVNININASPHYSPFQVEALIVWSKPVFKDGYFRCGLHFLKIEEPNLTVLREILADYKLLDKTFVSLTREFKRFLQEIKDEFDEFDRLNANEEKQIQFINTCKKEIFEKLDNFFYKTWEMVKDFERDKYIVHQNYYQQMLHPLLEETIEINRHIYRKPFGYSGDYIMMNYIYDYHNNNYLGNSAYEKLINNYTCNIPISSSNIIRKDFLKERIIETLERQDNAKVLSIACNSSKELIELLEENKITKPILFKCLDFDKNTLDYVNVQINKIDYKKRRFLSIEYICRDIISIVRDKELKENLNGQDLIYAFGIFDYLSERMASRITKELYQLLYKHGQLIICNASLENSSHRAYYEFLGEWNMVHRRKEQMLAWTKDISNIAQIKFNQPYGVVNYLFMIIKKFN